MCVGFLHKIHRSAQAMKGQWQSHASDKQERAEAPVNQRPRFLRPTGSFLTNAVALGMGGQGSMPLRMGAARSVS